MNVKLHPFQQKALFSNKRVTGLISGIQAGKTFLGALWMRFQVSKFTSKGDNFIVAAPDYKIMSQATSPRLATVLRGLGNWHAQDSYWSLSNERKVYLRSMHDPDSVEGIPGVRAIWPDEMGKMNFKSWVNLTGRAAPMQANILFTTTPYALNWVYRDLYKPWSEGRNQDIEIIQFRSIDNPYFPKDEYERQKRLLDERTFAMKYEGQFKKMAGLVFADFDDIRNMIAPEEIPSLRLDRWHIVAGVDFGYTNPTAITVRAINKYEKEDIQIADFYQSYLTPGQKVQICKQYKEKYHISEFICDSEDPGMIAEMNNANLSARGVDKGPGSLLRMISKHNELIRSGEYKLMRGTCRHTLDEYETYHYPEYTGKDENVEENPVDNNNHLMNANCYVTWATQNMRQERPGEPEFKPQNLPQRLMMPEKKEQEYNYYPG
jgi:PBSX family phage terminase large subunit